MNSPPPQPPPEYQGRGKTAPEASRTRSAARPYLNVLYSTGCDFCTVLLVSPSEMADNDNKKASVLVVDDEREHAQVMCEALERQGHRCDVDV